MIKIIKWIDVHDEKEVCIMKKGTVVGMLFGTIAGAIAAGNIGNKKVLQKEKKIDKFKTYYNILNQWLVLLHENKSVVDFFVKNSYKVVAIYGTGEMGNRLYEELKDSEIEVKYAIDKEPTSTYFELDVKGIDEELESVDVVVVTAVFAYDEILATIEDRFDCPIVSLEDVVYGV